MSEKFPIIIVKVLYVCYNANMEKIEYAKIIKQYREDTLISQEEFASMIGVSFASVNRWENGHFEPTLKAKRKIKEMLSKDGTWEKLVNQELEGN